MKPWMENPNISKVSKEGECELDPSSSASENKECSLVKPTSMGGRKRNEWCGAKFFF